jgi:hypothetical protein
MCIFVCIHKYMYVVVLVYICSMCKRVYEYYRCKIESIREWKLIEECKCEIIPRGSFWRIIYLSIYCLPSLCIEC